MTQEQACWCCTVCVAASPRRWRGSGSSASCRLKPQSQMKWGVNFFISTICPQFSSALRPLAVIRNMRLNSVALLVPLRSVQFSPSRRVCGLYIHRSFTEGCGEVNFKPCPLAARICCTFRPTTFSSEGAVQCPEVNKKASPPGRHQEQASWNRRLNSVAFSPTTFSSVQF